MSKYVVVAKFKLGGDKKDETYEIVCPSWKAWLKFRESHLSIRNSYARKVEIGNVHFAPCLCDVE